MKGTDPRGSSRPPYEEMVAFATRAPSVHNSQPWLWRTTGAGLELLADWSRQLSRADPDGRDVLISCGAALHHLRVAAAALGWASEVRHGPDPGYPRLLASIAFTRHEASTETARRLAALMDRQTDRRRFSSWPVPAEQLETLARAGSAWGATVTAVQDEAVRTRLLRLTVAADARQRDDAGYATELATWARERAVDGVAGEQAGQHVGGHHVVDRRQLEPCPAAGGPQQGTADAAEAVDCKAEGHGRLERRNGPGQAG